MKSFSAISESPGIQDVNNEQLERWVIHWTFIVPVNKLKKNLNMLYVVRGETIRIPGSQCGLANEHTSVSAVVKEGKSPFSSFKSLVSIRPFTRTGRHCHNLYLLCSHTLGPKLLIIFLGRIAFLIPQLLLEAQFGPWTFKTAVLVLKLYF